ncbi:hypothetical protein Vi05172_g8495 [Venturia inaequalis]|nr:hypothetical protein Vi05172_g8495 [Venturia inaequalis]
MSSTPIHQIVDIEALLAATRPPTRSPIMTPSTPTSSTPTTSTRANSPNALVTDLFKPSTNPAIEYLLEVQEILVDAEFLLHTKKRALTRANRALALAAHSVIAAEKEVVAAACDVEFVREDMRKHIVGCKEDIKTGYQRWRVENDLELAAARLKVLELEKRKIDFGELDELMEIAVSEEGEERKTAAEFIPVTLEALRP